MRLYNVKQRLVRIKTKLFLKAMNAYYAGEFVKEDIYIKARLIIEQAIEDINELAKEENRGSEINSGSD